MTRIDTATRGTIYIEGPKKELTGKKVYANLNGEPAVDGEYEVGFMWFIHVKNGIVTKVSLF